MQGDHAGYQRVRPLLQRVTVNGQRIAEIIHDIHRGVVILVVLCRELFHDIAFQGSVEKFYCTAPAYSGARTGEVAAISSN